jgi:capsular exopolysaccharide synthesis family protein
VLIIDGDLRIPSVAKKLQISSKPGVTNLLMNKSSDVEAFKSDLLDNWYIVPAGDIPPNPSELLGSNRMQKLIEALKEQFDYIVIDLPPVNIVSDALSISPFISGMIVVVREEYTEKKELTRCMRQLSLSNVKVLGCVLNEASSGNGSYGKYKYKKYKHGYGYGYGYGYYKSHKDNDETDSKENDK